MTYAPGPSDPPGPPGQPGPIVAPIPSAPARTPNHAGTIVTLAGFGVAVGGMFALPLNSYSRTIDNQYGFVETRSNVRLLGDSPATDRIYSGLAQFWWQWGAFAVAVVLLVLLCVCVTGRALRGLGIAVAVVALAGGVVHGLAMAQSLDYQSVVQFQRDDGSSFYTHPGSGVFVSLAGFAVVLVGGVLAFALNGRTRRTARAQGRSRTPSAAAPPPPPAPAAPPR